MKKIKLTQGKFALVDDEYYPWLNRHKWTYNSTGYAYCSRKIGPKKYQMILLHRLICDIWDERQVDHINGNRLDNRQCNLREASFLTNSWNRRKNRKKIGFRGVYKSKFNTWRAIITVKGITHYLGSYVTAEEASKVYKKAAVKYYDRFARS